MYLRDIPRKKIIELNNGLSLMESKKREQFKKKNVSMIFEPRKLEGSCN